MNRRAFLMGTAAAIVGPVLPYASSVTFTGVSLGAADADRIVLFCGQSNLVRSETVTAADVRSGYIDLTPA